MTDKQAMLLQFQTIASVIDERFDDLTIRQVKELAINARDTWSTLERRAKDRRG